jgi:hypothetical protein
VTDKEAKTVEVGRLNTIQGGLLVSTGGLTAEKLKEFYTDPKKKIADDLAAKIKLEAARKAAEA